MTVRISLLVAALCAFGANGELEVIGSGYGRTGTLTLKVSLNELGYKTYHMEEIVGNMLSGHAQVWERASQNGCTNIDEIKAVFEDLNYTATVDFPASLCWEALAKAYPKAKVVHTERSSAEQWWGSAAGSILIVNKRFPLWVLHKYVPFFQRQVAMIDAVWTKIIGKPVQTSDPDFPEAHKQELLSAYEANSRRVREVVPPSVLLVQNHKNGWTDLCKFLGKDVPTIPYPRVNSREEFDAMFQKASMAMVGIVVFFVLCLLSVIYALRRSCSRKEKSS